jgi:hypothetical protein
MVGIAADLGIILSAGQQLQNLSDAASLAGARARQPSGTPWLWADPFNATALAAVRQAAKDEAFANFIYSDRGLLNDADIIVGQFDRNSQLFTASGYPGRPNAVQVTGLRTNGSAGGTLPLAFGPIFGYSTAGVRRDAIATIGAGMGAALIVLNRTESCALRLNGVPELILQPVPPQTCADGAGVFVNSSAANAACLIGVSKIEATGVWINGGYSGNLNSVTEGICGSHDGSTLIRANTGICIPDPLGCTPCNSNPAGACVPEPSTSGMTDFSATLYGNSSVRVTGGDIVELSPGWYSKGIDATGGSLTLKPGVYLLGGSPSGGGGATGLSVVGNAAICAKGVMLYIMGPHGVFNLSGTGRCDVTPIPFDASQCPSQSSTDFCNPAYSLPVPAPPSYYRGISVFQSRTNTNDANIRGTSDMNLVGTFYFSANHLQVVGTPLSLGTQVIVDTMTVTGTSNLTIKYDGCLRTAGSSLVFLVE